MKFLQAVVGLSSVAWVTAAPMETCQQQSDCIDFTITESTDRKCGGATEYKVCATLNLSKDGCVKDGPISHICEKSSNTCPVNLGFRNNSSNKGNIPDGYQQCQYAKAGERVEFLFKDGNGCNGSSDSVTIGSTSATCATSTSRTCSGGGNIGKECIWTVQVPSGSGGSASTTGTATNTAPTPSTNTAPTPSINTAPTPPTNTAPTPSTNTAPTPSAPAPSNTNNGGGNNSNGGGNNSNGGGNNSNGGGNNSNGGGNSINSVSATASCNNPPVGNGELSPSLPGLYVNANCMEDNFKDPELGGWQSSLVCRAGDMTLESITSTEPLSCKVGEKVTVSLTGEIKLTAQDRYDVGWYIAMDGGDALTGTCAIKTLHEDDVLTVREGAVVWSDKNGCHDVCGDMTDKARVSVALAKDLEITCSDINNNGIADVGVCFSWRQPGGDELCIPDALYPGSPSKCRCFAVDIPEILVETDSTCI